MKGRAKEHYSWFDNGEKFLTHHLVQLCNIITYVHTYDKKGRLEYYIPTKKTETSDKKIARRRKHATCSVWFDFPHLSRDLVYCLQYYFNLTEASFW